MKQNLINSTLIILCILTAILAWLFVSVTGVFVYLWRKFLYLADLERRCWVEDCRSTWLEEDEYDGHLRCQHCGADQEKKPNKYAAAKRKEEMKKLSKKVIERNSEVLIKLSKELSQN